MASVNSLVLSEGNIAASAPGSKKSVEIGHSCFLGVLEVTNFAATTIDVNVEHSHNGLDWFVLGTFPQQVGNASVLIQISDANVHVLPNVRVDITIAGGNADIKTILWYDRHK